MIYSFYPGPAGGVALAKLLWGISSPSGRLSVSLPNVSGQIPAFYNRKDSYDFRYSDCNEKPRYSFGYGLNYTDFELTDFRISNEKATIEQINKNPISISFKIKNIGNIASYAVPQLYIHDKSASVVPRVRVLKDFTKIKIAPNETVKCELKLTVEDLKIWNRNMEFVAEAGEFDIFVYESTKDYFKGLFEIID